MTPETVFVTVFVVVCVRLVTRAQARNRRSLERQRRRDSRPRASEGAEQPRAEPAVKHRPAPVPTVEPPPCRTMRPAPSHAPQALAEPSAEMLKGPAYIVDGDTLTIRKTQIRLYGIDAPEMNHPFGKKAKWALVNMCKGQPVRAEITGIDIHGRMIARCYLADGRDLSAEMVRIGLAIDWPKYSGGRYRHLEVNDARRKMWLADARQKGRMHVWAQFDARERARSAGARP